MPHFSGKTYVLWKNNSWVDVLVAEPQQMSQRRSGAYHEACMHVKNMLCASRLCDCDVSTHAVVSVLSCLNHIADLQHGGSHFAKLKGLGLSLRQVLPLVQQSAAVLQA